MISDFNKKQKKELSASRVAFQIAGVLFLIIILVLLFADFKMYQKKKELVFQIDNYKKQIQGLQQNNQTLKDEIANVDNIDYLEKIAYEQLGQQKPGEEQLIFVSPEKKDDAAENRADSWNSNSWLGWIGQSWNWIKSKF